jgi:UPF0271 protein
MHIDLNSDLGEGCLHDAELLTLITSANVACGWHAGDAAVASATLTEAMRQRVVVGAHPSFPDRDHFGRRELQRSAAEIFQDCVYQVGALAALARAAGTRLSYIKAHGALYNMACRDDAYARPLVDVAEFFQLPLLGLPRSRLELLSRNRIRFVAEGFADRRYQPGGALVPRHLPDAFIHDAAEAAQQAIRLVHEHGVETICVHGDNPQALLFVRTLRAVLEKAGIAIRAFA